MNLLQSAISIDIQERIIYTDFMSLSWNGDYKNISLHANGMGRGTSSLIADFKQENVNNTQQNTTKHSNFQEISLGPASIVNNLQPRAETMLCFCVPRTKHRLGTDPDSVSRASRLRGAVATG
jgi:hypothetical protein